MSRSRWVVALGLLLALTASRHNFPIRHHGTARLGTSQNQVVRASALSKKYEGVVPSRRQVETRRAEWVRTLASTADLHPVQHSALKRQDELLWNAGSRRTEVPERIDERTTPRYLLAFLPSQPSRSLPPPV